MEWESPKALAVDFVGGAKETNAQKDTQKGKKKKKAQILDLKPNWRVLSAGVIINSPEFINVMDIKVNASHCGLIGRFVECEWGPWGGLPHFSVPFHFWPFPRRKPIGGSGWTEPLVHSDAQQTPSD